MTSRSARFLLSVAASAAVLVAACSGGGAATPLPTVNINATPSPKVTHPPVPSATAAPTGTAAGSETGCPSTEPAPLGKGDTRTVTITTPKGKITIKVEARLGPIATGNFVALAECGYYNNVVFHRLVPGFVIQAGDGEFGRVPNVDPARVGQGGPGYTIADEPVVGDYVRGAVAMARTPAPHSQGSQFFICVADLTNGLDKAGGYVILGHVTSGMEVVDAIAAEPNSGPPSNAALKPQPMTTVTVATP